MSSTTRRTWKRLAPGFYRSGDLTIDGVYVTAAEARGYGAGMRWTLTGPGFVSDPFDTLAEAKAEADYC